MPGKSPFSDDWRDCLKAHYTHVIRAEDHRTEKTLRNVLYECGFNADDLKEWYVLATMHVDDLPSDFVPDMELVQQVEAAAPQIESPPEIELTVEESQGNEDDKPPPPDKSGFQQLSLF